MSPAEPLLPVRALAKRPEDRFTDADELLEALLEAIDEHCDSDVVATTQMFSISGPTRQWACSLEA